ncbi:hypothetical protein M0802_010728 [Mischocyttarus mexicanus]|nr:hypothetical protein M0802_010728 [Mischocyttarus mexicanus]
MVVLVSGYVEMVQPMAGFANSIHAKMGYNLIIDRAIVLDYYEYRQW